MLIGEAICEYFLSWPPKFAPVSRTQIPVHGWGTVPEMGTVAIWEQESVPLCVQCENFFEVQLEP